MRIKIANLVMIFLLVLVFSCVEKYWPELDSKYEDILVVEGMITNEPGPYYIKLSLATSVENPELITLRGCHVKILDDAGNSENLSEISPGTYSTSATGIQGVVGRKYKIQILGPQGKNYQSEFEELKNPVGIDSVYTAFETRDNPEGQYQTEGYQFYLNTALAATDSNFFMWRMDRTYEYEADFKIRYIYEGDLRWLANADSLQTCWRTDNIRQIFTYNTLGLSQPVVKNYPLNFVNTDNRELSVRYSLLVKQLTISEKAYTFWNSIKEQNSDLDNLYSRQPYQVKGNVSNDQAPDETVLGYFLVAGISSKRIFVDRPMPPVHFYYEVCELTELDFNNVADIYHSTPAEWPIFLTTGNEGGMALPSQDCMDCRLAGGTIEKPDFWIDW
jgi:hypothetical protein